jgi:hypothetical protein
MIAVSRTSQNGKMILPSGKGREADCTCLPFDYLNPELKTPITKDNSLQLTTSLLNQNLFKFKAASIFTASF